MRPSYRIVSEIYEGAASYPAVVHIFLGDTPEKARGLYQAHKRTDAFLSACVEHGRFRDFKCLERHWLERFSGKRWVKVED